MKRSKSKGRKNIGQEDRGKPVRISLEDETPSAQKRRRRVLFRWVALSLPILFLLLVELGLRLFGYGYSAAYFLKEQAEEGAVYVSNPDFTRRFFPPGLARTPPPLALPMEKGPGTVRIFIFGESAAMGDPAPAYGMGRYLDVLLRSRYPQLKFEVANVAATAINSHVLRETAKDCVSMKGDIWILYMGNNEVVGPYGAGTVFGEQTPGLGFIRFHLGLRATRLGQWLESVRHRISRRGGDPDPVQWEGMEMFLDQQVRHNDPSMDRVYAHFERNLGEIIDMGVGAGAHVMVSTVVANLKDCPPFASQPAKPWNPDNQSEWKRLIQKGDELVAEGKPAEAMTPLQQAEMLENGPAELHYRIGRSYLALQDFPEAKRAFEKACLLDSLRFRVDNRLNTLIRQMAIAQTSDHVKLVDAEEIFSRQYPHRIVGEEFLYEHVHLNFDGNYLLALALAEQLEDWLPSSAVAATGQTQSTESAWLTQREAARRLALTPWSRAQVLEEVVKRLEQPPFNQQLDHDQRIKRLESAQAKWQARAATDDPDDAVRLYEQALALATNDWVLREQFATFLQDNNRLKQAVEQWPTVLARVPNHAQACYHMGNSLDKLGRSKEALPYFEKALRIRPEMQEARNGLALALANLNKTKEAILILRQAIAEKPDFTEARINLGQVLARSGDLNEAQAQYESALRYKSNSVAAHVNLARLLAGQGKIELAQSHYRQAIFYAPNNPFAHFNLGNLLADQGSPEADAHFEAAVRAEPGFAEARLNWGMALVRQGRFPEAKQQFEEAVRLRPDLAVAQLNLGVALAQEGQFEKAAVRFRETLRLDPNNEMARSYLQKALEKF